MSSSEPLKRVRRLTGTAVAIESWGAARQQVHARNQLTHEDRLRQIVFHAELEPAILSSIER